MGNINDHFSELMQNQHYGPKAAVPGRRQLFRGILKTGALLLLGLLPLPLLSQEAGSLLNVQGFVRDVLDGPLADGAQSMTFKLYRTQEGGSVLWQEIAEVNLSGGVFSHNLGSENALDPEVFDDQLYLGITINGQELRPRVAFTSAPYAMRSLTATTADQLIGCLGAVGDVKISALTPDKFREQNGDCWVLMDGQGLGLNTQLRELTGMEEVPDARGMFLRAFDDRGDQGRDPDRGNSPVVATVQLDTFASHIHSLNDPGHQHAFTDRFNPDNRRFNDGNLCFFKKDVAGWINAAETTRTTNEIPNPISPLLPPENEKIPTGITLLEGGSSEVETRPENLNFYIYIRID